MLMIKQNYSVLALACCTLVSLTGCGGSSNKDVTIPVISLVGDASASLEAGAVYTDAGATATDNIDGTITSSIVTVNPVDTTTVGTYTVTYNVSDAAGNDAAAVTRTVEVVEPVLTGVFTDSAVEGLTYTTATQSGVTDASGTFKYQAGESVVFSIGNFQLGEGGTAAVAMTPLDLIPDAALPRTQNELRRLIFPGRTNEPDVVAFIKLINMLVLLQALDSDKDATNGITIADGMDAIIDDVTIDLALEIDMFASSTALNQVMTAAVTEDLISSGFIKEAGQALNHFYQAQEITQSFKSVFTRSQEAAGDGIVTSRSTYTHDADGNMLTWERDNDGDGAADYVYTFTYDADGKSLTRLYDSNNDGAADGRFTYTYDANGKLSTTSDDGNNDGTPEYIVTYTYDANGRLSEESEDSNGDGDPDSILTITYTDAGNEKLLSRDRDADGDGDFLTSFTYGTNGHTLSQVDDTNADGNANRIYDFTHNANGQMLTQRLDDNADLTVDSIQTFTYDANGQQLTHRSDFNADLAWDETSTTSYDTNGNMVKFEYDNNGDGDANRIWTYTYDANGNQLTLNEDIYGDGTATKISTQVYDDSNIGHAFLLLGGSDG